MAVSISFFAKGQDVEPTKQKEVGLIFSSLNSFGLSFKTGTKKSMWRFQSLLLSGNNSKNELQDSLVRKTNNIGVNFLFGKEFRKPIADNLEFRFGGDLSVGYNHSKNVQNDISQADRDATNKQSNYSAGFNLLIGLNFVINNKLVIGAELLPFFQYSRGTAISKNTIDEEAKRVNSGFSYGISNRSALLTLAYRF